MASCPATKMREEATCPICLHLMTEPVSINCGHSYCHSCIVRFLQNLCQMQPWLETFSCPQCRMSFGMSSLRPNKQLGSLIEAIKEMDCEMSCENHGEKLHLFCEDEGQLICWRCERGPQHKGHVTALVEDACQGYKEQLQKAVTKLKQLEEECMNLKVFTANRITEWNEKIEIQRQKIQSDFENLQNFLHEEEKCYLWKLEKEKEQTLRRLRDNEANLEQKSHELKSHILELEKKSQGSAQKLLQNVKDTLSRSWAVKVETPEIPSLNLLTVCNVSELYFDVKKMLRNYQVSVTLDPDTAHDELILSEDRRQVTRGCPQENLAISSRRFRALPCILGCESFTSGRYYFEVDVGEGTGWDLGVCMENVQRDTDMVLTPQDGFWAIRLCRKKGYIALTSPLTFLPLTEQPLVVGIFLDCEAGVISFYNMTTGSHIFTFPKASFSDTLRPFFQVYQYSPLFLPPVDE
ncbi:E3 ubiquitin-protein ligase TRIM38 [Camelus dromedarius]|uniref:E3 ubiquitin-protein ligase TRIM38 n=1 Tax=Camelus bactrianus TaxID=9837 RepID=A0A9W3FFW7_CAMBA|nr:E3 ubiquitin-protein ligase TRIM38 [Camelus bactrianus]XP_010978454.1 E3 ubiquitin-protein ligase TRIM38 [Camelus dromedarius]XP_031291308.1 E3 ubiquitin-protein ligase TRIM38 [Camelus dromedarius]XP_031291309.1 E3 ubiquitin-protein ligase TRIM38 [Camelus dromedarius]XP_031291310.1 E3 ubiquitin-protein ligase TRIM38 [Camelus dromedarius]